MGNGDRVVGEPLVVDVHSHYLEGDSDTVHPFWTRHEGKQATVLAVHFILFVADSMDLRRALKEFSETPP